MTLCSSITGAVHALGRNITRALLTTLGIVIGIAAVITMMEIGKGSAADIQKSIENMGVNTLVIMSGVPHPPGGVMQAQGSAMSLIPEDCDAIIRDCPNVGYATPIVNSSGLLLVSGNTNWTPRSIVGISPDYLDIRNWKVSDGRSLTKEDTENRRCVCLVGQTIVHEVFGGESPVDSVIRLGSVSFTIVGVLEKKGANMMGMDEDDIVLAPWTTIRLRITGLKTGTASKTTSTASTSPSDLFPGTGVAYYPEQNENLETDTLLMPRFTHIDQIMVSAVTPAQVSQAESEVETLLRDRHHLGKDDDNDFWIRNSEEMSKMLTGTSTLMSNLLLVVALISLIVGGVGIMNIMLVSVTERTREIGLRMAVGARSRDILQQFLTESVLLCSVGGIIGILLGHGAASAVHLLQNWPVKSSPETVIAAFAVSAFVGIVFGFYPAWKASKLDPIEALRYE